MDTDDPRDDGWQRRMKWSFGVACGVVLLILGTGALVIDRSETHNRRMFERIRNGEAIEASALEFTGQRQFTELTDPESVDYFMQALRSSRRFKPFEDDGDYGGITYTVHIRLARHKKLTVVIAIPKHDRGMTLYTPLEYLGVNDPDYFLITFPEPMPKALAEVLKKLRK